MIVRETSCTGNNRQVRARSCPGNVFPGNVLSGKVTVRETSCPAIVLSGNRLVRERSCPGNVLSGKRLVRETSVRESDCPGNVRYPSETCMSSANARYTRLFTDPFAEIGVALLIDVISVKKVNCLLF